MASEVVISPLVPPSPGGLSHYMISIFVKLIEIIVRASKGGGKERIE